jgi:alpha-beta hydrolase superfamily lysophospholipase
MPKENPEARKRSRHARFYVLIIVLAVASFAVTWSWLGAGSVESYRVTSGILSYTGRPAASFGQQVWNETDDRIIYRIWFPSHGNATVYGLLAIPKSETAMPAFFILPGATVTKEGEQATLGNALNELGYATLILDQRSHGETKASGGSLISFDIDYSFWSKGLESTHHMAVYDALRAFDILYSLPGIDKSRIYAAGESMGGNYAMIAAGIEPRISGLMLISSSGYKFQPQSDPMAAEYMKSIVGDSYIAMLQPRPLLMLHAEQDAVVPLFHAQDTFKKAGQPKEMLTINSTVHSYTPAMHDILVAGLGGWQR